MWWSNTDSTMHARAKTWAKYLLKGNLQRGGCAAPLACCDDLEAGTVRIFGNCLGVVYEAHCPLVYIDRRSSRHIGLGLSFSLHRGVAAVNKLE